MTLYGARPIEILGALKHKLPPVSLFHGSDSVGKYTTALAIAEARGVGGLDLLANRAIFSISQARGLAAFATYPPTGIEKIAIVVIDFASVESLRSLLRITEEVHVGMHFIICSNIWSGIPETLRSRAEYYYFPPLTEEELTSILVQKKFKPEDAKRLAEQANGTVQGALSIHEDKEAKGIVMKALYAISKHDGPELDKLAPEWSDRHTELLKTWCNEALTHNWRFYSEAESPVEGRKIPMSILTGLRAKIRPRLVVRSTLMSILEAST